METRALFQLKKLNPKAVADRSGFGWLGGDDQVLRRGHKTLAALEYEPPRHSSDDLFFRKSVQQKTALRSGFLLVERYKRNTHTRKCAYTPVMVELKAAKTHTVLYQINRTEYYCQVDLPLSDYPLYGKQLVASRG